MKYNLLIAHVKLICLSVHATLVAYEFSQRLDQNRLGSPNCKKIIPTPKAYIQIPELDSDKMLRAAVAAGGAVGAGAARGAATKAVKRAPWSDPTEREPKNP